MLFLNGAYVPFILIVMKSLLMTNRYGNSDQEMQLCQRAAPQHEQFEPQGGAGVVDRVSTFMEDIAKYANIGITDELIAEIEGLAALVVTLQGCVDYVSMSSAIFLYVRKFFSKSVTGQVMEYIREVFELEAQDGDEDDVISSPDWMELMRNVRDNWALVKDNRLFSHFSKLLGLVVTLGMCKASDVTFSVKDCKVWEPDMKVVHGSAIDIVDAALGSVTFFVESLSLCYEQGSLKPLLMNDRAAAEIDEEYANIVLWWELVKNGNLKKVANMSDGEFDKRLETLTTKLRNLLGTKTSFEKKLIQDKFMRLLRIKNDYITMKISSGVRRAPYCIELFGGSSQGKTTCGEQIVASLLTSAGLPTGKEYQASYNAADKFMSTWSTDKQVLFIDDMANDKSQFVERPPTRVIIDVCNNQPFYANMADLDSKGKVFVEPALCVVTTNVKDLDARTYSNCPYSIQRRMDAVITVEAKEEFQYIVDGKAQGIDSAKVTKHYEKTGENPTFDDLWHLTIEKAVQPENLKTAATYKPVEFRGKKLSRVPLRLAMQYLIEQFEIHNVAQDNILERMKLRSKGIELCNYPITKADGTVCKCRQMKGYCDLHDKLEAHFGDAIVDSIQTSGQIVTNRIKKDLFGLDTAIESACTFALIGSAKHFAKHWDWLSAVPTPWLRNKRFNEVMMFMHRDKLKRSYIRKTCFLWGGILGSLCWLGKKCEPSDRVPVLGSIGTGLFALGITTQKSMVNVVKRDFERELVDRNTIAPMMKDIRDKHVGRICTAFGIVGGLYAIARVYKSWRSMRAQGSLEPKSHEEVAARDAEENVWTNVVPRPLPVLPEAANTTSQQLNGIVSKNQVYGTVVAGDRTMMVNGLFVRSNVVIVPDHYFVQDVLDVTFRKENPEDTGGKFPVRLSKLQSWQPPGTDIRYCYSSSGGSFKDLRRYLTDEDLPEHEFDLLWRSKQGKLTVASGIAEPCDTSNGVANFRGYRYKNLSVNTFKGMCGATLISKRKAIISSVHLGGKSDTPRGCSGKLSLSHYDQAMQELRKIEGVVLSGSAEKFEPQVLGVGILTNQPLHPKSPLNYMPQDSQVEYFGSCPGMTTFRSDVKVTPISHIVTEVTGDPNIYCGPVEEPQYFGWQTCLSNLAVPAKPFDPRVLDIAIRDYKSELLPIFRSNLWRTSRPLTDHENLCGIPGKKFMDSIKLNTSIGFPLSGPKRRFVTELEPTEEKPNNRVFDPEIMDEIKRCEDCYRRGERAYVIARACKKDEILSKKKCRIFYGNGIALTWLVRKYYLPLLRVLQMNPLKSECAVGVNSHGPEWDILHKHIHKFGSDRLMGGDYGKYDQKLPSQLLFAALRILIDFARECDYSEEDIRIMEAMTGDIVFAIIAFNGDLIGLTEGTHISGNSLTVILNGICGSLNLRVYYYTKNPPKDFKSRTPFREAVALMTYGDDNIGSVSPDCDNFTIKGISQFLQEYGQVYTMPDKESELLDFLPPEEFEFLKRKSVYHPALGVNLGALIDKSCFKMLHCFLRGKNPPHTEKHACGMNIDTAVREWFNHGESVYEERRAQMKEVASKAGISHLCTELDVPYGERVAKWKAKHLGGEYELFNEPDGFEC